ncbi:MAG: PKD domain-containing protein [Bacteroidetes bacterium]|nr:PKD domain-containing protein [Bacteroidota bacterium]
MSEAFSQCGTAVFTSASTGCINQRIPVTNNSSAGNYFWDFCTGDFLNTPTSQALYSLSSAVGRPAIELTYDGSTWYGFVTGTWTNTLYRLTYGNGPEAGPTFIDNLGDLSGKLNNPGPVRIISENNLWYGFIYCTATGELLKLSFGSRLTNLISVTVLYTNLSYLNSGLAFGRDATNGWTCLLSNASTLSIIRLGNSLTSPSNSDVITSLSIPNANSFADIDLINVCGQWTALGTNLGNANVYRFDFGTNLFSSPSITQIATIPVNNPGRLRIAQDGENYFIFVSSLDGLFTKLSFGNDLTSSPSITNEGNMGVLSNCYGLAVANGNNSNWTILSVSQANGQVFSTTYPDNCTATPKTSNSTTPTFSYSSQGNYNVSLMNSNSSGTVVKTNSITINPLTAPDITFTSQNSCANNNINFTSSNQSGDISTYQWDFGDATNSTSANPSHIYSAASTYYPSLTVTATNGCQNSLQDTLQVFNAPQATFTIPSVSPICTNQNYTFTNTSTYDIGSNPTWQWSVNDTIITSAKELAHTFSSSSTQKISLTASIPGCSSQSVQTINSLVDGPLVDFTSPTYGCDSTSVTFTNTSTGSVSGYQWNYGDGNTTAQTDGANSFAQSGSYAVSLTATNAAGCVNSLSKNISIYTNPQPDFKIELPPFSCAKSPAQFDNLTSSLPDSNISTWAWSFGDSLSGSSSAKNPAYTYSSAKDYTVTLQATTNFGCTKSLQKTVTISPSPQAGFTYSPACVNQSTQFTNASSGNITAYQWTLPNKILQGTTPTYSFNSSGSFPVTLTVTGANGCLNQVSKNITVPVLPVVDFSTQAPCTGHPTTFQELNPGGSDPAVSWNWNFGSRSATGQMASYQFPDVNVYSVTMNTTRQSGCVYSISKNISISTGPMADFTPSQFAGAAPLSVTFQNNSTGDSSFWQFGDSNNSTSTDLSPTFVYANLGAYKALLTVSNVLGCSDTLSTEIDVVVPHIDLTMNNFSLSNDPSTNSSKATVTVFNAGNIPLINPTVEIDLGGGAFIKENITGMIRPGKSLTQMLSLQIVPQTLPYICAIVAATNDADLANNKQCVALANEDVVSEPYPNPTHTGSISFDWISASQENIQITIFKSNGETAFHQYLDSVPSGLTQMKINTSDFSDGLYLIQFSGNSTKKTYRFIVAN